MSDAAGIPEELVISQLQALSPQQAKKLVMMMVKQGTLRQQAVNRPTASFVPSIFGAVEPEKFEVSLDTRLASFTGSLGQSCCHALTPNCPVNSAHISSDAKS